MKRCLFISLLSVALSVFGTENVDTICCSRFSPYTYSQPREWWAITSFGAGFTAAGLIAHTSKADWTPTRFYEEESSLIDFAQYGTMAFPWVMKMCGSETRSGWGRMAISHGASIAIMASTVSMIKDNHNSLRPDGSDRRSFPSGHTAWAYMGATWVAKELAWRSPWYAVGAYSFASAVAMQRVIDYRHMPSDVMAGIGIGVLSAQAGYYIGDIISGDRQLEHRMAGLSISNDFAPSISLYNSFSVPLAAVNVGGVKLSMSPAIETSVKMVYPFNNNWGIGMYVALRSTPIYAETAGLRTFVSPMNSLGLSLVPSYRVAINSLFALNVEAGARCWGHFHIKSINRSVSVDDCSMSGLANVELEMRLTDNMAVSASVGYELTEYDFEISPSVDYGIATTMSKSKVMGALNMALSTSVKF